MMNVELSNVELPISSFASKYFLKHITPLSFGEGLGGRLLRLLNPYHLMCLQ